MGKSPCPALPAVLAVQSAVRISPEVSQAWRPASSRPAVTQAGIRPGDLPGTVRCSPGTLAVSALYSLPGTGGRACSCTPGACRKDHRRRSGSFLPWIPQLLLTVTYGPEGSPALLSCFHGFFLLTADDLRSGRRARLRRFQYGTPHPPQVQVTASSACAVPGNRRRF